MIFISSTLVVCAVAGVGGGDGDGDVVVAAVLQANRVNRTKPKVSSEVILCIN